MHKHTTPQDNQAQALYNGFHVMILHVDQQEGGNEVLVSYEDGHEEYVPLAMVEIL